VGSRSYGVAPGVTLWAVKVLGCKGRGFGSTVIAGIDWCARRAKRVGGKWVANLSLGGGRNRAVNEAVANARDAGVIMVVAAGNNGTDACDVSPASEPKAITVGASTYIDVRAAFSNYGSCVDIFAPGLQILSLKLKDSSSEETQSKAASGTSMASPHVAGVAALYYQIWNTPDEAERALMAGAAVDKLDLIGLGSPNLLVQVPLTLDPSTSSPTQLQTYPPTSKPSLHPNPCSSDEALFELRLMTDAFAEDYSYQVVNSSGDIVVSSLSFTVPNQLYTETACLPLGQSYKFILTDSRGDGMCCFTGKGYFQVFWDRTYIANKFSWDGVSSFPFKQLEFGQVTILFG
jgi:subtilisin family serine protease